MREATSGVETPIGTFGLNGDTSVGGSEHSLDTLLTVEDVAAILKVNKSWVYEHTRSRGTPRSERLPYIKIGKYLRFEARAIRAYLEKKCRVT
jgi:predicted DNA-binding transcriptional regulator AlpA